MNIFAKISIFSLTLSATLATGYGSASTSSDNGSERYCTYSSWEWNTRTKRSQGHRKIHKPYANLTAEEKDPHSNCTVCEEDQVLISIEGVPSFTVCRDFSQDVQATMKKIVSAGFPITSVISHRVGRSKGPVDKNGLRTEFSHHSFGTAIDINAEKNGLYANCFEFGKDCQLLRGGPWKPGQPGTVTKDSIVYQSFKEIGWKWGGELKGHQKDFMHFSLSGD